jgi:predicted kinase
VRKDLAGIPHHQSAAAPLGFGLYSRERVDATYRELLTRARRLLELGESVVVDASWGSSDWRREAAELAASTYLSELWCQAPLALAQARITARRKCAGDASDASPEVAAAIAAAFEPWPTAICIDTTMRRKQAVEQAVAAIQGQD